MYLAAFKREQAVLVSLPPPPPPDTCITEGNVTGMEGMGAIQGAFQK